MAKPALRVNIRMGDPCVLPIISRHDYDAFRRLNGSDLPETYDEWLEILAELERQGGLTGHIVEERQVDPREFVRYCNPRGLQPDMNSLLVFVQEKAAGKRY